MFEWSIFGNGSVSKKFPKVFFMALKKNFSCSIPIHLTIPRFFFYYLTNLYMIKTNFFYVFLRVNGEFNNPLVNPQRFTNRS